MAEPPRIVETASPTERGGAELARQLAEVMAEQGFARLAIPGGSALAALGPARGLLGADWRRLRLTWVDERCVSFDDAESNRGAAHRAGLLSDADPLQAELPLYLDGEMPAAAVDRVEAELRGRFEAGLDVLLLGMGADGHVASLFPELPPVDGGLVAHVARSPKPPADRITLTPRALATARHTVLIATGESKRAPLLRLLAGDPALPAHGLRGLVIVTDLDLRRDAA